MLIVVWTEACVAPYERLQFHPPSGICCSSRWSAMVSRWGSSYSKYQRIERTIPVTHCLEYFLHAWSFSVSRLRVAIGWLAYRPRTLAEPAAPNNFKSLSRTTLRCLRGREFFCLTIVVKGN